MYDHFGPRGPRKTLLSGWYDGVPTTRRPFPEDDIEGLAGRAPEVVLARAGDQKWGPTSSIDLGYAAKNLWLSTHPEVRDNFNAVVREATGGVFGTKDIQQIQSEVIDDLNSTDAKLFKDPPPRSKDGALLLNSDQLGIVQKMLNGFPMDDLGKRARQAYRQAIETRRIRLQQAPKAKR